MHINFAYDILNKNFLYCVIEAKNKADERKWAVKMLSTLCESEKILAIMDRSYDGLKVFEHCNRIENLSYLIRIRSSMTKEIKSLADKELDLDLKFEVRTQTKRQPCKMNYRYSFPVAFNYRVT